MADATAHWTLTALLTLESAARLKPPVSTGIIPDEGTEPAFTTDDRGRWLLRGTAVMAALRETLAARRTGYGSSASPDAIPTLTAPDVLADRGTARVSARQTAGRTCETLLPGPRFPVRFDWETSAEEEPQTLRDLADALADGALSLGEGRRRGMGRCRLVGFRAVRHDLTTPEGWKAWAGSGYGPTLPAELPTFESAERALASVAESADVTLASAVPDARRALRLDFTAEVAGTLLIRGDALAGWPAADHPERLHLTENGAAILPGTTIAGTLRAGAIRILATLGVADAEPRITALFGTVPGDEATSVNKGRVRISEGVIEGGQVHRRTRGRLDPWTGAISDLNTFDEEPCVGGTVRFHIEVEDPEPADIGLLLLLARDLLEGMLPLGGGAAIGRGTLRGTATVTLPDGGGTLILKGGAITGDRDSDDLDRQFIAPLLGTGGGGGK